MGAISHIKNLDFCIRYVYNFFQPILATLEGFMKKIFLGLLSLFSVCYAGTTCILPGGCYHPLPMPIPKPMPPIYMHNDLMSEILINELGQTLIIWYDGLNIKASYFADEIWNTTNVLETGKGVVSLKATLNNKGQVLVSYIFNNETSHTLFAIFGENGGTSWDSSPTQLTIADFDHQFIYQENLNICLNDQNQALVSWKLSSYGKNFVQITSAENKIWNGNIVNIFKPKICANNPNSISLKLDNNGHAIAIWKMFVCGCYQIRATQSNDAGKTWTEQTTVAGIAVSPCNCYKEIEEQQ